MSAIGGPNIVEDGLVYYHDTGNFPKKWGVTQLVPDSEFTSNTRSHIASSAFTNVNYLGALGTGTMTGNSYIFSGGDSANYSVSRPDIWGWDRGAIGSTGGNWMYYNILPSTTDASRDFIVECKWRFTYISKTGNGSLNPTFQIGRTYTQLYSKSFQNAGSNYDWQYAKFGINGANGGSPQLTFGLSSADSAVEIDHLRCYEINKATGLKNLAGNSTIDLTNVSFDSNAQMTFDGTDDYIDLGLDSTISPINQGWTAEYVFKTNSAGTLQHFNSAEADDFNANWLALLNSKLAVYDRGQSTWRYGDTVFSSNIWYHISFIQESGTSMQFYVNGEPEGGNHTTFNWSPNYSALKTRYIGRYAYNGGYSRYFIGEIPVVKLYNRALTAEEVLQNYNATKSRFNL